MIRPLNVPPRATLLAALLVLAAAAAGLGAWWRHYPLLRAVDALQSQVAASQPVRLHGLVVYRATGGGCGQVVQDGAPDRHFVVREDGSVLLEPVGAAGGASLPALKGFWREVRRFCPEVA